MSPSPEAAAPPTGQAGHYAMVDRLCGLFILTLGVVVLVATHALEGVGLSGIGPGYFPRLCGALLVAIGAAIAAMTLRRGFEQRAAGPPAGDPAAPGPAAGSPDEISRPEDYPAFIARASKLTAGVFAFAVLLLPFGLIVATFALILIASRGTRSLGLGTALVLALILSVLASIIFVYGLNLPMTAFPRWPD